MGATEIVELISNLLILIKVYGPWAVSLIMFFCTVAMFLYMQNKVEKGHSELVKNLTEVIRDCTSCLDAANDNNNKMENTLRNINHTHEVSMQALERTREEIKRTIDHLESEIKRINRK